MAKYEYRAFAESVTMGGSDEIMRFVSIRDDLNDFAMGLGQKLAAIEPGDWEAVSHHVVLLDRTMVISLLARRPVS